MNIIFLDIDGVLNCEIFYKETPIENRGTYPLSEICKKRVGWLNDLCKETNAKVVISSTWRLGRTIVQLQEIFKELGGAFEIISVTPHSKCPFSVRGNEIQGWIDANSEKMFGTKSYDFKTYAIIDDDTDMLLSQRNNFFQTDSYSGLTPNTCYKIKRLFNQYA